RTRGLADGDAGVLQPRGSVRAAEDGRRRRRWRHGRRIVRRDCGIACPVRVVIASDALPLPFGRADARWLYVVASELARRSIDVSCVSCTSEPEEPVDEAEKLAAERGFHLRHVPKRLSESLLRRNTEAALRSKNELRKYDSCRPAMHDE